MDYFRGEFCEENQEMELWEMGSGRGYGQLNWWSISKHLEPYEQILYIYLYSRSLYIKRVGQVRLRV